MDILSNRALQTGMQVLKKATVLCLYGMLVAAWLQPEAFLNLRDPPSPAKLCRVLSFSFVSKLINPTSPFTPRYFFLPLPATTDGTGNGKNVLMASQIRGRQCNVKYSINIDERVDTHDKVFPASRVCCSLTPEGVFDFHDQCKSS